MSEARTPLFTCEGILLLALLFIFLPVEPAAGQEEEPATSPDPESLFSHFDSDRVWLSGQINAIFQAHPEFFAKYSGKNSLTAAYSKATSRLLTLYTGLRLNNSTELIVDVEEANGAALSHTLGLGGFSNFDAARNPQSLSKMPYLARAMLHKVFDLGGHQIENERNELTLFEHLPSRRMELRVGKFSPLDFFDQNTVGSDSHFQFTNWAIDANDAYDSAADSRGYTIGMMAEYHDPTWALRFAEELMPNSAGSDQLVWNLTKARAENLELELHPSLMAKRSTVIRILAYVNHANMGVYRRAIQQFEDGLDPVPDVRNHPWETTRKFGFGLNLEQTLSPSVIAFGRWGWNNGKTESFCFTEVDSTLSGGVGIFGRKWRRNQDRAGIAFALNAISADHKQYLADGGYGFMIGDGALTYAQEKILETYYTVHLWKGVYVSPGVQYIADPAYNQDRGPVVIPWFRLHLEM
jgi:high affinity Mn2+ porin